MTDNQYRLLKHLHSEVQVHVYEILNNPSQTVFCVVKHLPFPEHLGMIHALCICVWCKSVNPSGLVISLANA